MGSHCRWLLPLNKTIIDTCILGKTPNAVQKPIETIELIQGARKMQLHTAKQVQDIHERRYLNLFLLHLTQWPKCAKSWFHKFIDCPPYIPSQVTVQPSQASSRDLVILTHANDILFNLWDNQPSATFCDMKVNSSILQSQTWDKTSGKKCWSLK